MVGAPVIIKHQDVTNENADDLRCGVISKAYFNDFDGWYYCEGIIWDEKAKELVNNGWSVSCSYDFLAYNDEGGVENNIKYDKEFTQLNFTHLAIVDNPRYERANIVFNSKDDEKGRWVTIKGTHVFIPDGKSVDEVIKEKGWTTKEKLDDKNKEKDEAEPKPSDDKNMKSYKEVREQAEKQLEYVNVKLKEKNSPERHESLVAGKKYLEDAITYYKEQEAKEEVKKTDKKENPNRDKFNKEYKTVEGMIKRRNLEPRKEEKLLEQLNVYKQRFDKNLEPHQEDALLENLNDFKMDIYKNIDTEANKSLSKSDKTGEKIELRKDRVETCIKKGLEKMFYKTPRMEVEETSNGVSVEVTCDDWDARDIASANTLKKMVKEWGFEDVDIKGGKYKDNWAKSTIFWLDITRKNKADNSKEQEMKILDELKKLISRVENEKGEQDMDEKEKVDNENVDKRKLIDEVAGIMKSAGCDDEDIRTAIGKMEKIGYDKSEAGSADNKKVKNEEPDKKEDVDNEKDEEEKKDDKVDNEDEEDKKEVKEAKEEVKEDIDNKCKNSKSSFDKINEIYNSVKQIEKETGYVSRQQKLDNAVEYFK